MTPQVGISEFPLQNFYRPVFGYGGDDNTGITHNIYTYAMFVLH